jgi:ATP-binding cassette subfamily G (WHITE) protein 2 (PDR)
VVANRKTGGHTTGKILLNGVARDQFFNRYTGYVEQQDILMSLATVYEAVLFSAQLRLPSELSSNDVDSHVT